MVVSFKQDGGDALLSFVVADGVALEVGVEALLLDWVADFEKNPRILCCFPVDASDKLLAFLAVEGVLAGVRAGALDFSPIIVEIGSINWLERHVDYKIQMKRQKSRRQKDGVYRRGKD